MSSVAFSVDRLVVVGLDDDQPRDEAIAAARMQAAAEFGLMMDKYDGDEETIIALEVYDD